MFNDHLSRRLPSLLARLFADRRTRLTTAPPRLGGESLESRAMLAADFDEATGLLTLSGTQQNDAIEIRAGSAPGAVTVRGVPGIAKNTQFTGVNAIVVQTLGGNDRVVVVGTLRNAAGDTIGATIDVGQGNDRVDGSSGDDTILGGDGNDAIRGRSGNDSIDGGAGKDAVLGEAGDDDISGGRGRDVLSGNDGSDDIQGGDDDDLITGGDDDDFLYGDRGRDRISGGRGDDDLFGGDDADDLRGEDGDDDIDGEQGDDRSRGGRGNDDSLDDDGDGLDDDGPDDDDDGDGDGDDHGGGDDDEDLGTPFSFVDGAATLTGTTQSRRDTLIYSFTAPAAGRVDITINQVDGRWIDLEVEQADSEAEDLLELEPADDDGGPSSGSFDVVGGLTYLVEIHSPDFLPSAFDVRLVLS